jgi:hypothetical protein
VSCKYLQLYICKVPGTVRVLTCLNSSTRVQVQQVLYFAFDVTSPLANLVIKEQFVRLSVASVILVTNSTRLDLVIAC